MIVIELDGRLSFSVSAPEATTVELVGAFDRWDEEQLPMQPGPDGTWRLTLDPGPGTYLFRYLVDGQQWLLDESAHGTHVTVDGSEKSRIWRPALRQDPDALAA